MSSSVSSLSRLLAFFRTSRDVARPKPVSSLAIRRIHVEQLEYRCVPAFLVNGSDTYGSVPIRLRLDLNQPVSAASVQTSDLIIDGATSATSVAILDADTLEFALGPLSPGVHSASIAAGAISSASAEAIVRFDRTVSIAASPQYAMKQSPRVQLGDAPLTGYAGSSTDRVDLLWQTVPAGSANQDSFTVDFRPSGLSAWQAGTRNASIDTGVEGRIVHSASLTGLAWNSRYEYRVRHLRGDIIVAEYQSPFQTRRAAGDPSAFSFAAYGDSASGNAAGYRSVQARINAIDPAFALLLGDNVYSFGSHLESDARFDPTVNPEAAAWTASHIDYLGMGNHDVGTQAGLPSEQNFSTPIPVAGRTAPASPPASERLEHNYSWDYGSVHFLTFDTNSLYDPARLDALLKWAVTDLNASNARWKIVYGHHPLAGSPDKPEAPRDNYYQQVVNRLKAAGVDLFLTGHSHVFARTFALTGEIGGVATYVDHGDSNRSLSSEGLTQVVVGVGGVELRPGDFSPYPFVAAGFSSTTPVASRFGFAKVSVSSDRLTIDYVAADDGSVLDSFVLDKDADLRTATFQQGVSRYVSTVDTVLRQDSPGTAFNYVGSLKVDGDDPNGSGRVVQSLLRFDALFGNSLGQIPLNATLRSATLQFNVTNGSANAVYLHRMLRAWSGSDTWDRLTNGIQADDVEAVATPDASTGQTQIGSVSFDVLASLRAWLANPESNRGWAMIATGGDGLDFNSAEGLIRPKLIVKYVVEPTPNAAVLAKKRWIAVASGSGTGPLVRLLDAETLQERLRIQPYVAEFTGGVRVALGDVTGDGLPDIVTAAGTGGGPHIKVFDGLTGAEIRSFFAYDVRFTGGVFVAVGDVDKDGFAEVITGAGAGGGPQVRVFDGRTGVERYNFFAYVPNFYGGVTVAAGDLDGDGRAEIVTGPGAGGGPHVKVFRGIDGRELRGFFAYDVNFRGGVDVAVGDVNGDGRAEIVVGIGVSGSPLVAIFNGSNSSFVRSIVPFAAGVRSGVHVAAFHAFSPRKPMLLVSTGAGVRGQAKIFRGGSLATLDAIVPFSPDFPGGVFIAAW